MSVEARTTFLLGVALGFIFGCLFSNQLQSIFRRRSQ